MTIAPALRLIVSPELGERWRPMAHLLACVVVDAIAVAILLLGTPLPPAVDGAMAAVSHGTAVMLLSGLARGRSSQHWLCVGAMLAVPLIGAAVTAAVMLTRGRSSATAGHRGPAVRRPKLTLVDVRRLETGLSPCEALESGDESQRSDALRSLSQRRDPEAIALLRRTASGPDPDLALSAALALDEISEQAERRMQRAPTVELRHVEC